MALEPTPRTHFFPQPEPPPSTGSPEHTAQKMPTLAFSTMEMESPARKSTISNLTKIIGFQESRIELIMKKLKDDKDSFSAMENIATGKNTLVSVSEKAKEHVQTGIEFIESLFPRHILEEHSFGFGDELSEEHQNSITLMEALNFGLTGLSLIYKKKILAEALDLLKEAKSHYKNEPVPKDIMDWEISVKQQRELVDEEIVNFHLKGGKGITTILKFSLHHLSDLIPGSKTLISALGPIGSALALIISHRDVKAKHRETKAFMQWIKQYKAWQQETQLKVDMTSRTWGKRPPRAISVLKTAGAMEDYRAELSQFFRKAKDINAIKTHLKTFGIDLPQSIKTKSQLLKQWASGSPLKKNILKRYIVSQQTYQNLKHIADTSQNLLEKREAQTHLKLLKLKAEFEDTVPKLREFAFQPQRASLLNKKMLPEFTKKFDTFYRKASSASFEVITDRFEKLGLAFPPTVKNRKAALKYLAQMKKNPLEFSLLFKQWLFATPQDTLLKAYIDHQDTVIITTKNALKLMVQKKHELVDKFLFFESFSSTTLYTLLATSALFGAIATLTVFMGWPALVPAGVLVLLSIASSSAGIGFMLIGYALSAYYKRSTFLNPKNYLDQLSLTYKNLRLGIQQFFFLAHRKKMFQTGKILLELHRKHPKKTDPEYRKAFNQYKKAKADFEESQRKIEEWTQKANNLAKHIRTRMWKDYSRFANLALNQDPAIKGIKAFDTLQALTNAFKECDLSLLDEETDSFLKVQMGFDLNKVQQEMNKNPEAVQKALQHMFTLDEPSFISFIETQTTRMKHHII